MQIIFEERLNHFSQRHPNSESGLRRWRNLIAQKSFGSINEVREMFPHADLVKKDVLVHSGQRGRRIKKEVTFTVFNIGGNKTRLIAIMQYGEQRVTIYLVLTHAEYDAWLKRR